MFLVKLTVKNAFRRPLRSLLTIAGTALAVLAFGLLRTVVDAWYGGVAASAADRLVTRNAVSLVFFLPISAIEKIRATPGVKDVGHGFWFGALYIDEKNFFPNFAVDPGYVKQYPEFVAPPEELDAWIKDRAGAYVGKKTADRFGWKVGDRVPLKGTIFPGTWEVNVRAIYKGARPGVDETQVFVQWDYLNESLKKTSPKRADQTGFVVMTIDDPSKAAAIAQSVDALFKNTSSETLTETEKAFQMSFVSMSDAIIQAIRLVSLVVIVIIMAVAANTMAMTARERFGEYAVFKTLGFGPGVVTGMIMGESFVLSCLGAGIGAGLTLPAAAAFGKTMENFIPIFIVQPETLVYQLLCGPLVGFVAGIVPTIHASKVRIAEALRRVG